MSDWNCYCDQCEGRLEPPPEPCEYCSLAAGETKEHDGSCDGMTQEQYEALTSAAPVGPMPSARDLLGIAPDWTGGMSSVDWVRQQRDRS